MGGWYQLKGAWASSDRAHRQNAFRHRRVHIVELTHILDPSWVRCLQSSDRQESSVVGQESSSGTVGDELLIGSRGSNRKLSY